MQDANYFALVQLVCKGPIYVSNNSNNLSEWLARTQILDSFTILTSMEADEKNGNQCAQMETNGSQWEPMEANRDQWRPMRANES